jgi:hypothetical protein
MEKWQTQLELLNFSHLKQKQNLKIWIIINWSFDWENGKFRTIGFVHSR